MVKVENVTKVFARGKAETRAIDGVSLEVRTGEMLTVMGASGSGKSTLLHLIGGLDRCTEGDIYVSGNCLSKMTDDEVTLFRRRKIGFVFQAFHLLPTFNVEENVALPLLLDGKKMRQIRPAVRDLLEHIGLDDRAEHRPDELSGGQIQRVAIARALIVEPLLLLADEPTGNLDSASGESVLQLIKTVVKDRGYTTIMVTHDDKAAAYGDRIVHMRDGRIVSGREAVHGLSVPGAGGARGSPGVG